ncbi:MAG TPA: M23 family metallopeptidase [Actinoplanes sp.]|nr:M23 family metallopeptidase [Actinoplanes sp.]
MIALLSTACGAGAGVTASAAPIGGVHHRESRLPTAAHRPAAWPIVPPAGDDAPAKLYPRLDPLPPENRLAAARVLRKDRPRIRVQPAVAQWTHPNPTARMTSCFGQRWGRLHAGIDLAAPPGTPILAAGSGMVVSAGPNGGYGNAILIDHRNGWLTHYGHLAEILVQPGQPVKTGDPIGIEGSTGHSTGPHLHFEVHQGYFQNPVEPTAWMRAHGVPIPGCEIPGPLDRPAPPHRSGTEPGELTSRSVEPEQPDDRTAPPANPRRRSPDRTSAPAEPTPVAATG